jgi:Type IV leader peptidase family./Archaeal Peptidase A24 C-terminus Type II.
MFASVPDLIRIIIIPVFAYAAWRDVRTRRVPNRLWPPLLILGLILLVWEAVVYVPFEAPEEKLFAARVLFSVMFVAPFGWYLYLSRGIGAADAKAIVTLAVFIPTVPKYTLDGLQLPIAGGVLGVFSLTILFNALVFSFLGQARLAIGNFVRGHMNSTAMFIARPVHIASLPDRHGCLLETVSESARNGLNLDVLRMYLRWRGLPLATLLTAPRTARNPKFINDTRNPTDGRINVSDDIQWTDVDAMSLPSNYTNTTDEFDDPWGADRFFDTIDRPTYGATPDQLREGLESLTTTGGDTVWVAPGFPFFVPLFFSVLVSFTYGGLYNIIGLLSGVLV